MTDLLRFAAVYNDVENYPQIVDVANALGLSKQTVKNKAGKLRRQHNQGIGGAPELISRATIPMSERQHKFMESWTADDCLEELRRVAKIEPDRVVSRNYFRVHSRISDATWNRYFGTFEEYKRQAGISLSRQQHQLERDIAKHASVDHYRKMSVDRLDWGEKYVRDNPGRFKTIVTASDLHDIEVDPFWLRVFIDTCERIQPDVISLVGDIFDLAEFGRWGVDPREWDVVGRISFVHENIFRPLREACPNAQIDLIEGNHEARMLRMLADATPALRAVLSDLHGFTIGKLLGLEEFEINYVAQADLAAWTKREQEKELAQNYKTYYGALLCHHFPHARNMGMPGVNGHHHSHQVWPMFNPMFGAYEWHQMGCGHKRSASYTQGEKWHNGFSIANIDTHTKAVAFDYVQVTDFAISGGKWYHRADEEAIVGKKVA